MNDLVKAWEQAKEKEDEAKAIRLEIEEKILADIEVKEKGTSSYGYLKVSFGMTETWDQDGLTELAKEVDPNFFPFDIQYKLDRKRFDGLETMMPDLHSLVTEHLTLKPRKPAFKLNKKG